MDTGELITIVAGSRTITSYAIVEQAIAESGFAIAELVSGHASPLPPDYLDNVDRLGERWAREHGVPCRLFPADWKRYGKSAGPIRNDLMADYAQALIAVWDGKSRGTEHMIGAAALRGLQTFVYCPGGDAKCEILYSVSLPSATFGIVAVQGIVIEAAPIARWSIGKSIADVQSWVAGKGGTVYQHEVDIDWTPRPPTSRVPIFCEVCRKQGRVDRERQTITGAVMPLLDFLADKPRVCTRCKGKVSIVRRRG